MHSIHELRAGSLLITALAGKDDFFSRCVILVLDHDSEGSLGVALNKQADLDLERVLPQWATLVSPPRQLFAGGPVSTNGAICVAKLADPSDQPPGWQPITDEIGLLHLDTPVELAEGAYTNLRVYAGYAGWAPGQLADEIERGMWRLAECRDDDIFTADPEGLWERVCRRQGGSVAFFATMPADPRLN